MGDRVRVEIHNDTPGSRAAPERATNAGLPAAVEADRGRGLSIARAAAEASGGRLEVHVGESAAAVVELPRRGTHAAG